MKVARITLILTLFVTVSCSTPRPTDVDALCSAMSQFVRASDDGRPHSVTLRGGWGGDEPDVLMTHECMHGGYEPGKVLCAYLVKNTSWEFGGINANRALSCLRRYGGRWPYPFREVPPLEVTSSIASPDQRLRVSIRFVPHDAHGLSVLVISTTGRRGS